MPPSRLIMLGGDTGDKPALTFFFLQLLPGTPGTVSDYMQFIEDTVRPAIEVVPGVARVSASQGNGREEQILEILFDPYRAAQLGIDLPQPPRGWGRPTMSAAASSRWAGASTPCASPAATSPRNCPSSYWTGAMGAR